MLRHCKMCHMIREFSMVTRSKMACQVCGDRY